LGTVSAPIETVRERIVDSVRDGFASNAVGSYLDRTGFDVDAYRCRRGYASGDSSPR